MLRCFQSRDSGLLMHAFIIFVRPILEYCSVVWSPAFKKDIVRIEAVQRRFTKRLSGYSKLYYDERLASLNCESLYSRRVKCDLVMCYQMLTGSVNIDTNAFFTRSYLSTTRVNSMKLFKPQFTSVRHGNFFANRVISHWNSLSNSFVSSSSVASFKCKLRSLNFHL